MKPFFLHFILLFLFCKSNAQEKKYFDSNWKLVNQENAIYYRTTKKSDQLYEIKDFYIDGKIQFECYSNVETEPFNEEGVANWYFKNGNIERTAIYSNGKLNGKSTSYYSNGKIKSESNYVNGLPDGFQRNYFPSGKLQAEVNFVNGEMHGKYVKYQSESQLAEMMSFKNGVLDGPIEAYNHNYLSYKAFVKDGFPEGEVINYYYDSNQIQSRYKITNKFLDYYYSYSIDGILLTSGKFKDGVPLSFESKSQNINGSYFSSKMKVIKGIEVWTIYRDGKLILESSYKEGKKNGIWKYYNYDGSKLFWTIDFSKSEDCNEPYIQKTEDFQQSFKFSNRFLFDKELFKSNCKGIQITNHYELAEVKFYNEHPYFFIKKEETKTLKNEKVGPSVEYKKVSVKKDGSDGYAIKYEGILKEDYAYKDQLDDDFLKRNNCIIPYNTEYKDVIFCQKVYNDIHYSIFASENKESLIKLKKELVPNENEVFYFYQKYEDRIFKKGEKMDRYQSFSVPSVIKEAYTEKIMRDLDVIYVLENLVFKVDFNGSAASDALDEEIESNYSK